MIPSQDDGGFGSLVSDGEKAYLSLVWHRDEPTETRTITNLFLRKFGARKVNLPPELVAKAEKARLNLSPRLRGSSLDKWIENWIDENLDQKQKMTQGSLLASRFKKENSPSIYPTSTFFSLRKTGSSLIRKLSTIGLKNNPSRLE